MGKLKKTFKTPDNEAVPQVALFFYHDGKVLQASTPRKAVVIIRRHDHSAADNKLLSLRSCEMDTTIGIWWMPIY